MGSFGGFGPSQGGSGGGAFASSDFINVGSTTLATTIGDLAAGQSGGNELFWDESAGILNLNGGNSQVVAGDGALILQGANNGTGNSSFTLDGDFATASDITIRAGVATNGGVTAGTVTIQGGQKKTGSGVGGTARLLGGSVEGGSGATGGLAQVQGGGGDTGGNGGDVLITGGEAGSTDTGGDITITSGAGGSTSGNSGDVDIDVGSVTSGTAGTINIGTANASQINLGSSGSPTYGYGLVSRLSTDLTEVGNVGAGEDDLMSYTVPSNTLAADGDAIVVEAFGDLASNSGTRTIKAYIDGTQVISLARGAGGDGDEWGATIHIWRTSSTNLYYRVSLYSGASTDTYESPSNARGNEAVSDLAANSFIIKFTGEDSNSNTDEVQQQVMTVDYIRTP